MHLGLSHFCRQAFILFILYFTHPTVNMMLFYDVIKVLLKKTLGQYFGIYNQVFQNLPLFANFFLFFWSNSFKVSKIAFQIFIVIVLWKIIMSNDRQVNIIPVHSHLKALLWLLLLVASLVINIFILFWGHSK